MNVKKQKVKSTRGSSGGEMDHQNLMKSAKFLKNNLPRDESTVTAISLGQQQDVMMRKVLFDHNRKLASAIPPESIPS